MGLLRNLFRRKDAEIGIRKKYSMHEMIGSDVAAQELLRFGDPKLHKDPTHESWLLLLGTAVHKPDYFKEQPLTRAPRGETVVLPAESKRWGADFLAEHLLDIRECVKEVPLDEYINDVGVYFERVMPRIAPAIEGSDAYKVAVTLVLRTTLAHVFGDKLPSLTADELRLILEALADVGRAGLRAALYEAASEGRDEEVRRLLDEGADPNSRNSAGVAAMHVAAMHGHTGIVAALLAAGAEADPRHSEAVTPLYWACSAGHMEMAQLLLAHGADADARAGHGGTPLHSSAQNGNVEMAGLLLAAGANPNVKEESGLTPLHLAVMHGSVPIARMLLEKGANVNARAKDGYTPLHMAVHKRDLNLIELLLHWKADVDARAGHDGLSPLMFAESLGVERIAAMMREHSGFR